MPTGEKDNFNTQNAFQQTGAHIEKKHNLLPLTISLYNFHCFGAFAERLRPPTQ